MRTLNDDSKLKLSSSQLLETMQTIEKQFQKLQSYALHRYIFEVSQLGIWSHTRSQSPRNILHRAHARGPLTIFLIHHIVIISLAHPLGMSSFINKSFDISIICCNLVQFDHADKKQTETSVSMNP